MEKIKGGYYMKARIFQESAISKAPPHVREIWDWLLMQANHKDTKVCKRGQTYRSYKDMQEGLSWYVGYRKMMYKKHHCEKAMKWLKKATMVTTTKTTRGMLITILNYDKYQNPKNYESYNENSAKATMKLQGVATINKNEKNEENNKNKKKTSCPDNFPVTDKMKEYAKKKNFLLDLEDLTEGFLLHHRSKGNKFVDWYSAWQKWLRNDMKFYPDKHLPMTNHKPTYITDKDVP